MPKSELSATFGKFSIDYIHSLSLFLTLRELLCLRTACGWLNFAICAFLTKRGHKLYTLRGLSWPSDWSEFIQWKGVNFDKWTVTEYGSCDPDWLQRNMRNLRRSYRFSAKGWDVECITSKSVDKINPTTDDIIKFTTHIELTLSKLREPCVSCVFLGHSDSETDDEDDFCVTGGDDGLLIDGISSLYEIMHRFSGGHVVNVWITIGPTVSVTPDEFIAIDSGIRMCFGDTIAEVRLSCLGVSDETLKKTRFTREILVFVDEMTHDDSEAFYGDFSWCISGTGTKVEKLPPIEEDSPESARDMFVEAVRKFHNILYVGSYRALERLQLLFGVDDENARVAWIKKSEDIFWKERSSQLKIVITFDACSKVGQFDDFINFLKKLQCVDLSLG